VADLVEQSALLDQRSAEAPQPVVEADGELRHRRSRHR
jgi:hypothetical protein